MKRVGRLFFAAAALAMPVPAAAQSASVADAFQSGQVGERFDGYLGMVGTSSDELRRQVAAINLRRRNLYIDLASRRNVTAHVEETGAWPGGTRAGLLPMTFE